MSEPADAKPKTPDRLAQVLRWVLAAVVGAAVLVGGWLIYAYNVTPAPIRHPSSTHYHFRMQVISDGRPVNFAETKYQTGFNKDVCTAALTKEPVHFHDQLNQFVHIHWKHMTGGLVLKNYGWNRIGGTSRTLGYRFDQLPKLIRVPFHGRSLPAPPPGARYYVYVSSVTAPTDYWQQSWDDFLHLDLEKFFSGKASSKQGLLGRVVPAASAHDGVEHDANANGHDEEQLARINNVLGNVVIFAQKNPPSSDQIKDRFEHLIDLPESSCGG